jgi:hypothetical protein
MTHRKRLQVERQALQAFVEVPVDLVVCESDHVDTAESKVSITQAVGLCEVGRSVDLDCESTFGAVEVDDERADHVLAPELEATQSPSTDPIPDQSFCIGLGLPQLSGTVVNPLLPFGVHLPTITDSL